MSEDDVLYDLNYLRIADCVKCKYIKKKSKKVWNAFNNRNITEGVLTQPRGVITQNLLYYEFEKLSPVQSRRGKPRRVIERSKGGAWLIDFKNKSAFYALLSLFWSNPGDHMHIRIYCVFSPYCVNKDIEKLLEYLDEKKTITMDIYFANIHDFRINKPEEWLSKNSIPDGIKLRRLANHKNIKEFRIFGRKEWEFIADKLDEEVQYEYEPKDMEDIWDKKTYGDEEYADVWKAVMGNSLGELRHKIWPEFPLPDLKTENPVSSNKLQDSPDILEEEEEESSRQDYTEESSFHFVQDYNKYVQENFSGQNGVDKRIRSVGRNEWKKITREATILANF